MKSITSVISILIMVVQVQAEVQENTVLYSHNNKKYMGRLFSDKSVKDKQPGLLIAPEWWGLTQHERDAARRLAAQKYVVLVMDFYGAGRTTTDPGQAKEWMQEVQKDDQTLSQIFDLAMNKLKEQPSVDKRRLGALGFGMGGGLLLEQARLGKDLRAIASFYGGFQLGKLPPKPVNAEILAFVGEDDFYIDKEQIAEFKSEMKSLQAKIEVVVFPGVYHEFANQLADKIGTKEHLPYVYDKIATQKAWARTELFFKRILSSGVVF